jgi:uncharacterized protein
MHFFLTLTTECNLRCTYCFGECVEDFESNLGFDIDSFLPPKITYSIQDLKTFLDKDPSPTLIFYGGEPLLEMETMKEIMDRIDATYILQTNGLLLDMVESEYAERFRSIIVSIDGDEETTDYFRGRGTYQSILRNIRHVRKNGYDGEIVARMTVMEPVDIHAQVRHLLGCGFKGVHWQLNALFWDDFKNRPFQEWVNLTYNPGIRKLVTFWMDEMRKGRVHRIYPFSAIMEDLLLKKASLLRCGAGHSEYHIQTDGVISPCPVMQGMRDFYAGSIFDSHPLQLKKYYVQSPCPECRIYGLCGGRCLYANVTKRWGEEGFRLVCETVETLIDSLSVHLSEIRTLIENGTIRYTDFEYTHLNSCEIIP